MILYGHEEEKNEYYNSIHFQNFKRMYNMFKQIIHHISPSRIGGGLKEVSNQIKMTQTDVTPRIRYNSDLN